jgi:hypothetical protein
MSNTKTIVPKSYPALERERAGATARRRLTEQFERARREAHERPTVRAPALPVPDLPLSDLEIDVEWEGAPRNRLSVRLSPTA